jgi:hypothetical protein
MVSAPNLLGMGTKLSIKLNQQLTVHFTVKCTVKYKLVLILARQSFEKYSL